MTQKIMNLLLGLGIKPHCFLHVPRAQSTRNYQDGNNISTEPDTVLLQINEENCYNGLIYKKFHQCDEAHLSRN